MNYLAKITGYLSAKSTQFLQQNCILCGKYDNSCVCVNCEKDLTKVNKICNSCGVNLNNTKLDYCGKCLAKTLKFSQTFVVYDYAEPTKTLIHKFKYDKNLAIGSFFSHKMLKVWQNLQQYDAIIPMPLHKKRLRSRGFNQVVELLSQIKKQTVIDSFSCRRIKYTQELNKLNPKDRKAELRGAFKIVKPMNYKSILIVDDVMTTTTSTTELSKTILKSYGKNKPKIDVLVLARVNK